MPMAGEVALFACCREPVRLGQRWVAPVGRQPEWLDVGEPTGEIVPLRRIHGAARHEGGHAAVQIALGGLVVVASVDGQPHVKPVPGLGYPARAVVTLAGPAADAWTKSSIARVPDAELAVWIAAIRDLKGGGCDRCSAVRSAIVECDRDEDGVVRVPSDEAVVAEFRKIETLASALVRLAPCWAAIDEIAGRLRDVGTLHGDAVLEICSRHFRPGFFQLES
jgi:hypothetical protein